MLAYLLGGGLVGGLLDGFILGNIILLPITFLLWKIYGELRQLNGKQQVNIPGLPPHKPQSPPPPPQP